MGMMETLFEKMDSMISHLAENNKLRAAEAGAAPAAEKAKPGRKPAEKAAGPVHTEAELVAKFEQIKADVKNVPALKALIDKVVGTPKSTLPQLRQMPEKFDEAYAELESLEASLAETDAAADDDL